MLCHWLERTCVLPTTLRCPRGPSRVRRTNCLRSSTLDVLYKKTNSVAIQNALNNTSAPEDVLLILRRGVWGHGITLGSSHSAAVQDKLTEAADTPL